MGVCLCLCVSVSVHVCLARDVRNEIVKYYHFYAKMHQPYLHVPKFKHMEIQQVTCELYMYLNDVFCGSGLCRRCDGRRVRPLLCWDLSDRIGSAIASIAPGVQ